MGVGRRVGEREGKGWGNKEWRIRGVGFFLAGKGFYDWEVSFEKIYMAFCIERSTVWMCLCF
jgi:hypothetical protein